MRTPELSAPSAFPIRHELAMPLCIGPALQHIDTYPALAEDSGPVSTWVWRNLRTMGSIMWGAGLRG